ncbi:cytokine receptor-like [Topomyia yanbarensis]|uniref:cytokine receptor-like n=1 Tax=Topomyia yanbarensis TaxID=2498891 RepID=UPI00273C6416|nr:cytokine receptor-like [Topomyia yanbarensis]
MLVIVSVVILCMTRSALAADGLRFIYGNVFKSASEIDLQLNVTSYTVGCKLESTGNDVNSQFLGLYLVNKKIESQIINATTIITEVDLQPSNESEVCGVKTYVCKLNQTIVHSTTVFVGRAPTRIDPADFKCVSENREFLWCEFPRNDHCDLNTLYKLSMIRHHVQSECALEGRLGDRMRFDSRSDTCLYSAGHRSFTFELESLNVIGRTDMEFHINHYDLVRPAAPKLLQVINITTTRVDIAWNLNARLLNLDRKFEYQFLLVSEYGLEQSSFVTKSFDVAEKNYHTIENLSPYTGYELSVRVRVVSIAPRNAENEYWSDWSSAKFRTKACKPHQTPVTAPGAYSLKEIKGDFVTAEVYWQQVSPLLHNGPGFSYNVSAISTEGERFHPTSMSNETALFHQLKIGYYLVQISCYNREGPSDDFNVIEIFPPAEGLKPTIRKILLDDEFHQLSWYSVPNLEYLLNYTVIYCNFTATGSCRDAIKFAVLPPTETTFNITSERVLNFAVAAHYRNYSSDLAWQKCVVSSVTGIAQPKFSFTDISANSFVLRMNNSCTDRSLVQRYGISVWTADDATLVQTMGFDPYVTVIPIGNLKSSTEYNVTVAAYDDSETPQQTTAVVRTIHSGVFLHSLFYSLGVIVVLIGVSINTSRKVKKMMNIKVDIPLGLMGIDETINNEDCENANGLLKTAIKDFSSVNTSEAADEYGMDSSLKQSCGHWKRPKNSIQILTDDAYVLPSSLSLIEKLEDNQISTISYPGYVSLT